MSERAGIYLRKIAAYLTPALLIAPVQKVRYHLRLVFWVFLLLAACEPVHPTPIPSSDAVPTKAVEQVGSLTPAARPSRTPMPPASPTPLPTSAIDVPATALRGLAIQFWHPFAGEAQVFLDQIAQEFNRTNSWGIQIENTSVSGFTLLGQRLRQAALEQTLPDVWTMFTYQALQIDANGTVVTDLQPYIQDSVYGLTPDEQKDFLPALWNQDLVPPPALKGRSATESKRLGLAWTRTGVVLVYNQTWAEELGFTRPPETPEEFQLQVCAATNANSTDSDRQNDGTGGWAVTGDPAELLGWLQSFGAQFSREDGRGYQFSTPEARQAVNFLEELVRDGCAWKTSGVDLGEVLGARRALLAAVPLADLGNYQPLREQSVSAEGLPFTEGQDPSGTQTVPAVTDTVPPATATADAEQVDVWLPLPFPSPSGNPAVVAYGPSLVVGQSQPERQLAAWLFVRWLTSAENQARWVQFTRTLPVRQTALEFMQPAALREPAWETSLQYLPYLQAEPYYVSWSVVRWTLEDAVDQLFKTENSAEQADLILKMLDELAAEIHLQVR